MAQFEGIAFGMRQRQSKKTRQKLEALRIDFAEAAGRPFSHFYCPVLFKDERSPLCRAHIVNAAFPESSRQWTLQRQDVDNFYGSVFEADFVDLRHGHAGAAAKAFIDPVLYKRLRPKIFFEGKEVEHFVVRGPVPSECAYIEFQHGSRNIPLALKMSPAEFALKAKGNWQIEVFKDIRLAAIASVLKAAHLTLFDMLGYRYALGPGGRYLGELLGQFFLQNVGRAKSEVVKNAGAFFEPWAAIVRPVLPDSPQPDGTIDNSSVRVCWCEGSHKLWGIMVFVRAYEMVHAVVVPVFSDLESESRFDRFIGSCGDTLDTSFARFDKAQWNILSQRITLKWPAASLS